MTIFLHTQFWFGVSEPGKCFEKPFLEAEKGRKN